MDVDIYTLANKNVHIFHKENHLIFAVKINIEMKWFEQRTC